MAWSYNIASGLARDRVRLYIGDTLATDPQLQDEEIDIYVGDNPDNPLAVAAQCCTALAARYARQCDKSLGQLSISASQRMEAYQAMAIDLRQRAVAGGLVPMEVGGMTRAEHTAVEGNTGLEQPTFSRGMYDLPGNGDMDRPTRRGR